MAKRTYPALLEPADGGGFGISFPDLPGCVSFADSLEEAPVQAAEALSLHLEGMAEDGEKFADHDEQAFAAAYAEAAPRAGWMAVTVEAPDQAERVNIYLQKSLLERIDAHSEQAGFNRSAFFVRAARAYLGEDGPHDLLKRDILAREVMDLLAGRTQVADKRKRPGALTSVLAEQSSTGRPARDEL
jgi:predicted RNase H-like HicB family nuclease